MLADATKDARARAEQIAAQGSRSIANLHDAEMGVFQITPLHETDTSSGRAKMTPVAGQNHHRRRHRDIFAEVNFVEDTLFEICRRSLRRRNPARRGRKLLVKNVCTDSRQAKPGDLFFAIKGEQFDGHDFLNEVAAKGVAAVVVEQRKKFPRQLPDCAVLVVDDARAALGKFAAAYRREFDLPVVAVGGSNGKTTTKELIASVLRPEDGRRFGARRASTTTSACR